MGRSSRSNGKTGVVNMALKRILPIRLTLRTRARLSVAFKTSIESSLILYGSFLNGSKVKLGDYREWFNYKRFHRGVKAYPADLYKCNVGKLT